jgi:O-antigen biosynthesis rhamnosyltransferase
MKILHFYKTYYPDTVGGIEKVINQLIQGTDTLGCQSEVLTLSSSRKDRVLEVDGHKVYRCKTLFQFASTPFSMSVIYRFWKLAKRADVIHYHSPYPLADFLHLFFGANKPSIVSYHSDIVKQKYLLKLYRPFQRQSLSRVNYIAAASSNYIKSSAILSEFKDKVAMIPYGLDKSLYPRPSLQKLNKWTERFGSRFFLFLGVLRYYKGLHVLLESAVATNYPIVIAGTGPVKVAMKAKAAKLGLKNVHFIGHVSEEEKVSLLQLCYAVLLPSHLRSEAFGISLLEGAMYGKPLISAEIGTGTTYVNIHEKTGLVVPPNDPKALRSAMDYLWGNPLCAAEMGRQSELRYEKFFTAEKMALSYVRLYKKIFKSEAK